MLIFICLFLIARINSTSNDKKLITDHKHKISKYKKYKMNKLDLRFFTNPFVLSIAWGMSVFFIQGRKKYVNDQQIYKDLKQDIVTVHNQSIDESQSQPLLHLLKTKRYELQPDVRKKLETLEEWKRDDLWTYTYKYATSVGPAFFAIPFFPKLSATAMFGLLLITQINYINDRDIMSGGREKSIYSKDLLPKQDQLYEGFKYVSYGIFFLAMFKFGLLKINQKGKDQILNQWKKTHGKK